MAKKKKSRKEKAKLNPNPNPTTSITSSGSSSEQQVYAAFRNALFTNTPYAQSPSKVYICCLCMRPRKGRDFVDASIFLEDDEYLGLDVPLPVVMKGYCGMCTDQMLDPDGATNAMIADIEEAVEEASKRIALSGYGDQAEGPCFHISDEHYIGFLIVAFRAMCMTKAAARGEEIFIKYLRILRKILFPEEPRSITPNEIAMLKKSLFMEVSFIERQKQGIYMDEPVIMVGPPPRCRLYLNYIEIIVAFGSPSMYYTGKNTIPVKETKETGYLPKGPCILPAVDVKDYIQIPSKETLKSLHPPPDPQELFTGTWPLEGWVGPRTFPREITHVYAPFDCIYHDKKTNRATIASRISKASGGFIKPIFENDNYAVYSLCLNSFMNLYSYVVIAGRVLFWFFRDKKKAEPVLNIPHQEYFWSLQTNGWKEMLEIMFKFVTYIHFNPPPSASSLKKKKKSKKKKKKSTTSKETQNGDVVDADDKKELSPTDQSDQPDTLSLSHSSFQFPFPEDFMVIL